MSGAAIALEPTVSKQELLREKILELVAEYAKLAHAPRAFNRTQPLVPVSGKVYGAAEVQSLVDSSLDFWLTTGRFNEAFEQKLQRFLKIKYALTCNSGSS